MRTDPVICTALATGRRVTFSRPVFMNQSITPQAARRPWTAPRVQDLPRLTQLTLATGGGIPGGDPDVVDSGGSTVF